MRPQPILLQKGEDVSIMYLAQVQIIYQHSAVLQLTAAGFYHKQALERSRCWADNAHLKGTRQRDSAPMLWEKG